MSLPTAEDVLRTIEATLENVIKPGLSNVPERSAAATIGHLLRHVRVRLAAEGQILTDDIAALRALLPRVQRFLDEAGQQRDAGLIAAALADAPDAPGYASLTALGARACRLRGALQSGLAALQALRSALGEDHTYLALRAAIRDYMAVQIEAERCLIEPAFLGFGPRR